MSKLKKMVEPKPVEEGPAPINGERHGVWRILTVSLIFAVAALSGVALAM